MTDKEILDIIQEKLNYHLIVWYDGEHFQLACTRQELYQGLYDIRQLLKERESYERNQV